MSREGGGRSTSSSSAADGSGGGGGGGGGRRKPSCGERENNRRRERRRRAVASKIYRGLRAQGNYNLPKHSDNNQVLKALCNEAGWIVEPDGTTYRKGFKPAPMETGGTSTNITPSSSRNPSPPSSYFASPIPSSYQQSPSSSSFPSPSWLDANTSLPSFAFLHNSIPSSLPPLRISNSAPVSPPLSSPTRLPNQSFNFEYLPKESVAALNIPFFASSAPGSPTRWQLLRPSTITECDKSNPSTTAPHQWMNFRAYGNASDMVPPSPTFNLVRPMAPRVPSKDAMLEKERGTQFDFEKVAGKPWEGERIHEVGLDDLELTLGSGSTQN